MATETTAGEAAHGAAEHYQGMPQLEFAWFPNQIFWLVVTLVIIYLVLSRVALPRIASVLSERQGAIAADLARAEELREMAVEAEDAYNKALADARSEAQTIIGAAKAEIQKDLDAAMAKADAEIAAKTAESEKAIQAIRAGALQSITEVATDTATAIIEAVMPSTGSDADVKKAVAARMKG